MGGWRGGDTLGVLAGLGVLRRRLGGDGETWGGEEIGRMGGEIRAFLGDGWSRDWGALRKKQLGGDIGTGGSRGAWGVGDTGEP